MGFLEDSEKELRKFMDYKAFTGEEPFNDIDNNEDEYDWRNYCEDGSEYFVYPEDYETEEEYEEALEDIKTTETEDFDD